MKTQNIITNKRGYKIVFFRLLKTIIELYFRSSLPLVRHDQRRGRHSSRSGHVNRIFVEQQQEQQLRPTLDEQQGNGIQSSGIK